MIKLTNKEKFSEILYFVFIFLIMFNYGFENINTIDYGSTTIHDIIQYSALCIALFCFILKKIEINKFICMVAVFFVGILCYISGGWTNMLISILAIYLLENIDIDHVLLFIFIERLLIFISIIIMANVGILHNQIVEVAKSNYSVRVLNMGFSHPNAFATNIGILILLYLCINRESMNIWKRIILIILDIGVYKLSGTRTTFILIMLAIIFEMLCNIRNVVGFKMFLKKIMPFMYIMILIFMFVCIGLFLKIGYTNNILNIINDKIFNGRLGLGALYFSTYHFSLFGNKLDMSLVSNSSYYALDNGYVILFMYYGVIGFLLFMYIIQKLIYTLRNNDEVFLMLLCIVMGLWAMYEGMIVSLAGNFMILFYGKYCRKEYGV